MDIMEFDAASKTGVEDIREILEASQYTPILGRYKIFIIDEVHMLSKSAFNALLKTLEEPPKHVKFIFATTELHKVPETVLSRCMTFQLRPVTEEALNHHLIKIADLEGFTLEVEAAAIMTEESEGSVRDALSMLEQATMLAHDSKAITADMILSMLGSARQSDINQLLNLVIDAKTQEALEYTEKILKSGCEPMALHKHLQKELYKTIAERVSNKNDLKLSNLLYLWQILLKQTENIKNSAAPDNILKAAVIVLAHTSQFQCIEDLMIYGDNLRESPNEKSNKPSDTGNSLINNVLKKFPGSIASEVE
jgi:DNA polymerase-3 subunit gamma/tau